MKKFLTIGVLLLGIYACTITKKPAESIKIVQLKSNTTSIQDQIEAIGRGNGTPPTNPCTIYRGQDEINTLSAGLNIDNVPHLLNTVQAFDNLGTSRASLGDEIRQSPFIIKADSEPMQDLKSNYDQIQSGIFLGFGLKKGAFGLSSVILYLTFVNIDIMPDPANALWVYEKTHFAIFNNQKKFYIYENGTWQKTNEAEIDLIKNEFARSTVYGSTKGYYIGKAVIMPNPNTPIGNQHIYLGFDINTQKLHLFNSNELLRTVQRTDAQGQVSVVLVPPTLSVSVFSTFGFAQSTHHLADFQSNCAAFHNHGTIRPCPEFCPM
jgi:hypothetical protein